MFRNTKLSTRLIFGFGTILVLLAVIVVVVMINLNNMQNSMTRIVDVNVYKLNLCQDMTNCIWKIKDSINEMVLATDSATREELKKTIDTQRETYDVKSAELDQTAASEAGLELRQRIKDNVQAARPLINKVIELANSNNTEEAARVLMAEADPAIDKELASLEEGVQMQNKNNESEAEKETASNKASFILIIILGSVAILAGIAITVIITRSITKPVKDIVINLTEGAHQVASAAGQLSATSQQLAEGNSEQAASIEETSATLEEASSMISQNAENTNQAALLAAQTKTSSDKGNADMMEMMNSMVEIKKSSDQIAKIIKVIDDIAFQTNILALNAAVEAARAGDAGMGFAVVAEEVRNLAQRSAQAAKDTASIIESNISLSENGVSVAKKVGESLAEITVQAKKVNELMDEIAAAGREQSQGISQINKAISQMEAVTQQNAANAEESASASEELSAQAEVLRGIVHRLVVLVDGNSSGTDVSARPANGGTAVKKSGYPAVRVQSRRISSAGNESKKTAAINPEEVIPLSEDLGNF